MGQDDLFTRLPFSCGSLKPLKFSKAISIWNMQLSMHSDTSCCLPGKDLVVLLSGANKDVPKSITESDVVCVFLSGKGDFLGTSSSPCCTELFTAVSFEEMDLDDELELLAGSRRGDFDLRGEDGCETITYPFFSESDTGDLGDASSSTSIALSSRGRFPRTVSTESAVASRPGDCESSTSVASVSLEESVPLLSASSSSSSREVTRASLARSIVGVTEASSACSSFQNRSAS